MDSDETKNADTESLKEAQPDSAQDDSRDNEKQYDDEGSDNYIYGRDPSRDAEEEPEPTLWLITFTDIMALMLTFFVLLYAMSMPEQEKWEDIIDSLNNGLSKYYSPPMNAGVQDTISVEKLDMSDALNLDYLRGILEKRIQREEMLSDVVMIPQSDHMIISLPQELLFEPGEAEVNTEGKRALFALGGMLARIRNRIEVVGHSDPRPISSSQRNGFQSNWELSLARATEVSGILTQVGYRRNMIVRGASSARYDELPEDMEEEKRLDLSRRVDIIVMQDDGRARGALLFE